MFSFESQEDKFQVQYEGKDYSDGFEEEHG